MGATVEDIVTVPTSGNEANNIFSAVCSPLASFRNTDGGPFTYGGAPVSSAPFASFWALRVDRFVTVRFIREAFSPGLGGRKTKDR